MTERWRVGKSEAERKFKILSHFFALVHQASEAEYKLITQGFITTDQPQLFDPDKVHCYGPVESTTIS